MRDFDIYGVIYCEFLFHPCGGTPPYASLLLMALRNPRGANYCAWRLYVLLIQWWGTRSTVDIFSISLGESKPVQFLLGI